MKTISEWRDFTQYGIECLTGERCPYSLRLLCDVNEDGKRLLEEFFQIIMPYASWNSTVNGKDAVNSVMLPRGIFQDLALFCLFHVDRCVSAYISPDGPISGLEEHDHEELSKTSFRNDMRMNWNYNPEADVTQGSLNVHQFTGRVK